MRITDAKNIFRIWIRRVDYIAECILYAESEQSDEIADQLFEILHLHGDIKALDYYENVGGHRDEESAPTILVDKSTSAQYAVRITLFALYKQYGHRIFKRHAKASWFDITFAVLGTRLAKYDAELMTNEDFFAICDKAAKISKASIRRYTRTLFESDQLLQHLEELGCMYPDCPERQELLKLRLYKGDWSREDERMVVRWVNNTKICNA